MRSISFRLAFAFLACSATPAGAADTIVRAPSAPVKVQLDSMPLGALVTVLMRDIMGVPYVIAPEVLNDRRPVSVNLSMAREDLPVHVVRFLRNMGLNVELRAGTVYVAKQPIPAFGASTTPSFNPLATPALNQPGDFVPSSAPQLLARDPRFETGRGEKSAGPVMLEPDADIAVIKPAHRSPVELGEVLRSIIPTLTVATRSDVAPQGAGIAPTLSPDMLVVSGSELAVKRAVALVQLLDKPRPTVEIRAVVFEVRNTKQSGSALSVLANLMGGKVQLGSLADAATGDHFLKIAAGGLKAALSVTKGDGRFKVVAEPSLAALSGSSATINSGSQVPTVGSVTYSEDGTPVRSVVYRDSGVSLTVAPTVRGGEIEMAVTQERSTFVATETGVNDTPTLNKSTSSAHVAIRPGETIAIAGLDERSDGNSRRGLFGGLLGARSKEETTAQLIVLIQADIADDKRHALTVVDRVTLPDERVKGGSPSDTLKSDAGAVTAASSRKVRSRHP